MVSSVRAPGTAADASFDRYARMVQRYLDVPVGLVSLVHDDHQQFIGQIGLDEPEATTRRTPLSHSFCQYVVEDEAPLVVTDAREDDRLRDNLAITDLGVVSYAGWPLIDESGRTIGSLCAIDHEPRRWTHEDLEALSDLADACSAEMMYRRRQHVAEAEAEHATTMSRRSSVLLGLSEGLSTTTTLDDIALAVEQVARESLGCLHAGIWLRLPGDGGGYRLQYVSDPSARWSSAARNSALPVDDSNPLGEVLSRGRPLFFVRKDDQNARYPHLDLSEQVGEARAFLPLTSGTTLGALALLWDDVRDITADERLTLATLASYTAQAVQRALLLRERDQAALTLQNAMLTQIPAHDRLDIAALYRPAAARDRVGGDWYDAVVTPSGETYLMVGDVMGHDMAAAAVMGELRSMLRALAWSHDEPPARNMVRLDKAAASFGITRFASLLYAHVGLPDGTGHRTVTWTNAGHLAPVLVHPDGAVETLDDGQPRDLLLGIDATTERRDQTVRVADGSVLLLYTDGLVERRGEPLETGLARFRERAAATTGLPASELADALLGSLVGDSHEDDVALMAVRFV